MAFFLFFWEQTPAAECSEIGCSGQVYTEASFTPARVEQLGHYYDTLEKTETNVDVYAKLVTKPARTDLEKIYLLWRASRLKNLGHVSLTAEEIEQIRQSNGDPRALADAWYAKILKTQTAVCYESAHLFTRMAQSVGFEARVLIGDFRRIDGYNFRAQLHDIIKWYNSPHAWARIKLKGKHYHIDAQGQGIFLAPYSFMMGTYRPYHTDNNDPFTALSQAEFMGKAIMRSEDGRLDLKIKKIPGIKVEFMTANAPEYPVGQRPNLRMLGTVLITEKSDHYLARFRLPQEGMYSYDMKVTYAGVVPYYLPIVIDNYGAAPLTELYPKQEPDLNKNFVLTGFSPQIGVLNRGEAYVFTFNGPGLESVWLEYYDENGDPKSAVLRRAGRGFSGKFSFGGQTTIIVRTTSKNSKGATIHHAPLTYEVP